MVTTLDSRGRTTIPKRVRSALGLSPGDRIVWTLEPDGCARVRRLDPGDEEYLSAVDGTLSEWGSDADEKAYKDL
ncbi:AbrB/MazE/SpoVT family DNA-binding domain-containing protein [Deferrisoma palaeochoriense]